MARCQAFAAQQAATFDQRSMEILQAQQQFDQTAAQAPLPPTDRWAEADLVAQRQQKRIERERADAELSRMYEMRMDQVENHIDYHAQQQEADASVDDALLLLERLSSKKREPSPEPPKIEENAGFSNPQRPKAQPKARPDRSRSISIGSDHGSGNGNRSGKRQQRRRSNSRRSDRRPAREPSRRREPARGAGNGRDVPRMPRRLMYKSAQAGDSSRQIEEGSPERTPRTGSRRDSPQRRGGRRSRSKRRSNSKSSNSSSQSSGKRERQAAIAKKMKDRERTAMTHRWSN